MNHLPCRPFHERPAREKGLILLRVRGCLLVNLFHFVRSPGGTNHGSPGCEVSVLLRQPKGMRLGWTKKRARFHGSLSFVRQHTAGFPIGRERL